MAKIKGVTLSDEERAALERAWRHGSSHEYRQRCRMILLKGQYLRSQEVAQQVGCCEPVVNTWLRRFQERGLAGLQTRGGRGRRAILQTDTDLAAVRLAVQNSRQRVSLARAELTNELGKELGKEFSALTLRRFLKKRLPLQASSTTGEAQAQRRCVRVRARVPV